MSFKTKLIVAQAANGVIGKDNDLIWHLPADMRFFTQTTQNSIVIMGRKNWDSIPLKYRPLANRINVVVTRNKSFSHPDCSVFTSLEEAIAFYSDAENNSDKKEIFIIGGGQIYSYALEHSLIDEMYITEIDHSFDGDTFFPSFDATEWTKTTLLKHDVDERNKYPFTVYHYAKKPE
jgi:dihydrofolate reductase